MHHPSSEVDSRPVSQEILKLHYRVHKSPSLKPIRNQINPVYNFHSISFTLVLIRVRFPAVQDFSLLHSVETYFGAQPASYPMGTGGSFPGGKAAGREANHASN
jgi:hypothetical protein